MNYTSLNRRNFLKTSLLGGTALAMPWTSSRVLAAAAEPAAANQYQPQPAGLL